MPVEFHRRGLALFYYVTAIAFLIIGILSGLVAVGDGIGPERWSSKIAAVLEWGLSGVVWICGAPAMWLSARKYRHNLVRLTAVEIFIHTAGGKQFTIPYSQIRSVDCPARRLTIHTPGLRYEFDQQAIPRLKKIAKLLQAHVSS